MVVVADTSPITALIHLRQLNLLELLYGKIYIPVAVAKELETLTHFGYDITFLNQQEEYIIRRPKDEMYIKRLSIYIDEGEAEAIALAKEIGADLLLIDEKLGKQYAIAENISCKGVIGTLIEAKKKGLIKLIQPLLDDLINNLKFRLSDKIYEMALKKAGE